jgi:hypothetical protein
VTWISEAGPIVVSLAALALAARQMGQQRTLADLGATRDVLEAGAIHLHRAGYAMDPLNSDLMGQATSAKASLQPLGIAYDEISERITVRLGRSHAVTLAYVAAGEALLDVWRAVDRVVVLHLPHLDGAEAGQGQALDSIEQERMQVIAARQQFDVQRVAFVDAAAQTAGSRLRSRRWRRV